MSERPTSAEMLLAEIYGWKWDDRYDTREEVLPAAKSVIDDRPALKDFYYEMCRLHEDTVEGSFGPMSWRDFRNMTATDRFEKEFDRKRIFYEIEGRIRLADSHTSS